MAPKPAEENSTTAMPALFLNPKVLAATGRWAVWLTPAHLVASSLLGLMFLATLVLAVQYAFKYRKYQVAEDLDSLTDNSACSGSMQAINARRTRAMSSSTLISEVVSLVRLPRRSSPRHGRLDEVGADVEEGYESNETQADAGEEEEGSVGSGTLRPALEDEHASTGSQRTIVASAGGGSVRSTPSRRSASSSLATTASGQQQAEVKYARPVKLRTFGPVSPVSEEAASTSEDGRRFSATSASTSLNNGFSPASSSSNSTLRRCSGKESKERRNRERLLRGPGSEFSLGNPELDLELDYYDYNVVNAAAAPGSYLGMDPAFLVWIPPMDEADADANEEDDEATEEPLYEEIAEPEGKLDTEGAALTPAEYRRFEEQQARARRLDPGECRLHDEIIMEYKARLVEGLLPIHRILEDSRLRVSEETLSNPDVIPNRVDEQTRRRNRRAGRARKSAQQDRQSSESSSQSLDGQEQTEQRVNDLDTPRARRRPRLPASPRRSAGEILNASDDRTDEETCVNIPLAEFSRSGLESPAKVHSRTSKLAGLSSPDQGVDVRESKRSFYELIADGGDGIKFADDDDDCVDSNVVVG